jgi:cardiolipin synthase A/B
MNFVPVGVTYTGVAAIVEGVLIVLALIIAPLNRRPSSALAWILLIVALPIVGVVLFLIIGNPKLPASRRDAQGRMNEWIEERARLVGPVTDEHGGPDWLQSIATLNETVGGFPLLPGNNADLFPEFDEQFAAIIEVIDDAERFLHVEFYILALDPTTAPFFAALERAVQRGVDVKLLVDHLGSHPYPGFRRARKELTRIGVEWHLMLPVQPLRGRYQRPDLRNHRKVIVADGLVAFMGSMNIVDPGYERLKNRIRHLRWHDLMVRLSGPVVREVDAIFVTDWHSETGVLLQTSREVVALEQRQGALLTQIAPSGPAFDAENNLALFNSLIYAAQERLTITTPYFVPDESLLSAITTAARRGVAVELFVGEVGDQFAVFHAQHSYYRALLDAGVRIWLYPRPGILHAKAMSVDDEVAVVGSSNMDIRSFQLDFEVTLLVSGKAFVDSLRRIEDGYRAVSREVTSDAWNARRAGHRFVDNLMRLTSAVQ